MQKTRQLENKWNPASSVIETVGQANPEFKLAPATTLKAPEPGESLVRLVGLGNNKIQVIKVVRELTQLGLKESKDLVESAPVVLRTKMSQLDAQAWAKKLQEAGAIADLG